MSDFARFQIVAVVCLAAAASPVAAAEPTDIASLFPPNTLAYAELTNPAELSPQFAALFKGSCLEDSIPFIHKRKDAATSLMELQGKRELAGLGLLASPELAAEFKKLRGVAAGVTGFTDGGEPEVVLAVLTGDSTAAGLAARAFLTMTPTLRKVGDVSKVPVFQYKNPEINYDPNGLPMLANPNKALTETPTEWTFAYTPGLFVVGTGKRSVAHILIRYLGEEKAGLAGTALFKDAAARFRHTGVFFVVNFPEFIARYEAANKLRGGMGELDVYAWFAMTANTKAITSIAGNLRFENGGLAAVAAVAFDPKQKSPLWDFLSGPTVNVVQLQHARRPAALVLSVSLPEKDRAQRTLALLDAIAKSTGELGRLPCDVARELEAKYKVAVRDLLAKTQAATLIVPAKQELPKGGKPLPILVLHAVDEAAAAAWEEFFPKLVADLAGAAAVPQVSTETIGGVKVSSLPANGLPWNAPVHFARRGRSVAIGLDRKLVAASTSADPLASSVGAAPFPHGPAVLAGSFAPGDVVEAILNRPHPDGVVPADDQRFPGNGNPVPEKLIEETKKARADFFASLAAFGPTTFVAHPSGNHLVIELFQSKVRDGGMKTVIDAGALWLDRASSLNSNQFQLQFDR